MKPIIWGTKTVLAILFLKINIENNKYVFTEVDVFSASVVFFYLKIRTDTWNNY